MHKEHINIFILIIKKPHKRLVFSKQLDIGMIGLSSQVSKWLSCVWLFVTSWTVVHGILQTRILEWVALPFSSRSSWPRNQSLMGFPHISVGKEFACHEGDPSLIPGSGRCLGEGIGYPLQYSWASLVAQLVKNLLVMQETWVWSQVSKLQEPDKSIHLQSTKTSRDLILGFSFVIFLET